MPTERNRITRKIREAQNGDAYRQAKDAFKLLEDTNEVLHDIMNHVPELWGDEVKNGYPQVNILADIIDDIEGKISKIEEFLPKN